MIPELKHKLAANEAKLRAMLEEMAAMSKSDHVAAYIRMCAEWNVLRVDTDALRSTIDNLIRELENT